MKLRSVLVLIVGMAIGYQMGKRAAADDPNVVKGPRRNADGDDPERGRAVQLVSSQGQRLADRASVMSLAGIRRARGAIRGRLTNYDDATWN